MSTQQNSIAGIFKYNRILNFDHLGASEVNRLSTVYFSTTESIVIDSRVEMSNINETERIPPSISLPDDIVFYKNHKTKKLISREYAFLSL